MTLAMARAVAAAAVATAVGMSCPAWAGELRKVALAPLSTLGEEARSRDIRRVQQRVLAGLARVPDTAVLPMKQMLAELKRAKRDDLRNCDGDASCLADLGALLSADLVVYGEVGGVGEIQIAYLKLVDVTARREVRSTTLEIEAADDDGAAHAAAMRLLAPKLYVGALGLNVDVSGASIYVDGVLTARSPTGPISLSVGTHAIRVTHAEYRDFVRFVDIAFQTSQTLAVGLQQYPIVASDMRRNRQEPAPLAVTTGDEPTPWYRRWYTIAGGGAVLLVGSAVLFAVIAGGVDADQEKVVD
jgi:hypothetical protein